MESRANPELVIYKGGKVRIEPDVFRAPNLPRIIIDSKESIRSNLNPVDVKVPSFIFQTVDLMETVYRLKLTSDGGKQNPCKNQEPNPHETTKQKKKSGIRIYHIHWTRSTLLWRYYLVTTEKCPSSEH